MVPKLRVASCAKTGVVGKRLPIGDRFREEEQTSVPHCYGEDTFCLLAVRNLFFFNMSGNHMFGSILLEPCFLTTSQPHDATTLLATSRKPHVHNLWHPEL